MTAIPTRTTWHKQSAETILRALGTTADQGLCDKDATEKLRLVGPNEIAATESTNVGRLLLHQLSNFMIVLLIVAAIVSGVIGDIIDTIAIVVIVVLNASVGVFQEYRAQRAIAALRKMSALSARVIRDGKKTQIAAANIVPGDIVQIEAGEVVPADMRLIETTSLNVDESTLTGESLPVTKQTALIDSDDAVIGDYLNMGFKSTQVTRGHATGVVVATGHATEIGRIADLLRNKPSTISPLQKRLERLGRRIGMAVILICTVIFATGLLQGQPGLLMFMTALSLAVAAVPEALPAVVTVSLGLGARHLSKLHALVRRLHAVETLGSVTYICADKTGTLTENRMALGVIYADSREYSDLASLETGALSRRFIEVAALCNDVEEDSGELRGEPTELALIEAARAAGFDKRSMERTMPRIAELPFESERRYMVTAHATDSGVIALVKGAPESVISNCIDQLTSDGRLSLDPGILDVAARMASSGYRVLALACRENLTPSDLVTDVNLESDWTFIGLVGLSDPPRPEAYQAIEQCKLAGIVPVMITGDHPATANFIAAELGISEDDTNTVTGAELEKLTDRELERRAEKIRVYARVDAEAKIRIVHALQNAGHFVAMTGDGVNDAPALKHASIGVAMGQRGTDVAREAAELVLLDDNFATIVTAIHEGRRIFDDIRKFVKYALTTNSGEIWLLFLAPFLGLPLPLLPLHLLWINLITDGLPGLALSAEPAERNVMHRPPRTPDESIFAHGMGTHIIWVGFMIGSLTLATEAWALQNELLHWQTIVFTTIVVFQLFHCLAIRSERYSLFQIGVFSNRPLILAIAVTILAQLAVIYVPALNTVFKTQPLTIAELLMCCAVGSTVFFAVELEKFAQRHRDAKKTAGRS
jgi:Ca2+-transporting ATPase